MYVPSETTNGLSKDHTSYMYTLLLQYDSDLWNANRDPLAMQWTQKEL